MWGALVTPLVCRTEKWWGSVMNVELDPELTKWSVRLGPAIILTGKGYKEYHWLVVPSINHFGYLHSHLINLYSYHADVCTYYSQNPRSVRQGPRRCPSPQSSRELNQRREGYYSLHVQRGRLPRKSLRVHRYTCTELVIVCT